MPRFVLLRHEAPASHRGLHWDLMLEDEGVLRTWALGQSVEEATEQEALQLPDHRLAYLDYEGEVSGGRGRVTRIDRGEYATLARDDSTWRIQIHGETLAGDVSLERLAESWRLQWRTTKAPES